VQVPAVRRVAVVLETVQTLGVVEVKVTARPEVAVALSVSGVPLIWVGMAPKVMVCAVGAGLTVMFCGTVVAAA
jgi:hypothetical protein